MAHSFKVSIQGNLKRIFSRLKELAAKHGLTNAAIKRATWNFLFGIEY